MRNCISCENFSSTVGLCLYFNQALPIFRSLLSNFLSLQSSATHSPHNMLCQSFFFSLWSLKSCLVPPLQMQTFFFFFCFSNWLALSYFNISLKIIVCNYSSQFTGDRHSPKWGEGVWDSLRSSTLLQPLSLDRVHVSSIRRHNTSKHPNHDTKSR